MRANVDPVRITDIKDSTRTGRSLRSIGTVAHIEKLRVNTHLEHGGYRCTQVVLVGAKPILPWDLHGHIYAGVIVLALKLGNILIVSIHCKRQPKGRFNAQHIHPIIQITIEGGGSCCVQTLPRLGTDMSWFGSWHYCFCYARRAIINPKVQWCVLIIIPTTVRNLYHATTVHQSTSILSNK